LDTKTKGQKMLEGEIVTESLQHYAIIAASISAIFSGAILIYKKVILPVINHLAEWYKMLDKIDQIYYELTPNEGGSVKDKIDKINTKVDYVSERQKSILQEHEYALVETNAKGEVTWVNRTYTRLVQRERSEVMRTGWINVIAKEDRERVWKEWEYAVKDERELNIYFNFETPEGTKIPVKAKSYILTSPDDNDILGYLACVEVLPNH
jgi:PAS domain-containing protein